MISRKRKALVKEMEEILKVSAEKNLDLMKKLQEISEKDEKLKKIAENYAEIQLKYQFSNDKLHETEEILREYQGNMLKNSEILKEYTRKLSENTELLQTKELDIIEKNNEISLLSKKISDISQDTQNMFTLRHESMEMFHELENMRNAFFSKSKELEEYVSKQKILEQDFFLFKEKYYILENDLQIQGNKALMEVQEYQEKIHSVLLENERLRLENTLIFELESQIKALKNTIKVKDEYIFDLLGKNTVFMNEIDELKKEINMRNQENIFNLEANEDLIRMAYEQGKRELDDRIKDYEQKNKALFLEIQANKQEISSFLQETDEFNKKMDIYKKEAENAKNEQIRYKQEISTYRNENDAYKHEIEAYKVEIEGYKHEINDWKENIENYKRNQKVFSEENVKIKQKMLEKEKNCKEFEEKTNNLEGIIKKLENMLKENKLKMVNYTEIQENTLKHEKLLKELRSKLEEKNREIMKNQQNMLLFERNNQILLNKINSLENEGISMKNDDLSPLKVSKSLRNITSEYQTLVEINKNLIDIPQKMKESTDLEKIQQKASDYSLINRSFLENEINKLRQENTILTKKFEENGNFSSLLRVSQQRNAELSKRLNERIDEFQRKEKDMIEEIERLRFDKENLVKSTDLLKKKFEKELNVLTYQTQECLKMTQENNNFQNSIDFLSSSIDERVLKVREDDLKLQNDRLTQTLLKIKLGFIEERTNMLANLKRAEEESMDSKMKYAQVALDKDYYYIKYQNLVKELQRRNIVANQ